MTPVGQLIVTNTPYCLQLVQHLVEEGHIDTGREIKTKKTSWVDILTIVLLSRPRRTVEIFP